MKFALMFVSLQLCGADWPAFADESLKTAADDVTADGDEALSSSIVTVWPEGRMPGQHSDLPEVRQSPERTDAIRITNISCPTLTYFPAPDGSDRPVPAVIVCPGGGYRYVVMDKEGTEVARRLNQLGIDALVLKYRTPNERAGALQDLQRAIRVTRQRAAEWRIAPQKIGVLGFSAGGHLAAVASTQYRRPSYRPIDQIDELSGRPNFAVLVYPAYLNGQDNRVSPELDLSADIPPTLVIHNEDDRRHVRGSRIYAKALGSKGDAHRFQLYKTGGHGYGVRSEADVRVWPNDLRAWLVQIGVL